MSRRNSKAARKRTTRKAPPASRDSKNRRGTGVRIAPSLLAADFANLSNAVRPLKNLQLSWLHLDIMDGHFVPNISFGPGIVSQVRELDDSLYFDCHLMVEEPRSWVKDFADAGADSLTFHVEAAQEDSELLLKYIRRHKMSAGISLKPRTKLADIEPYLPHADLVLVMTVEPGFGGQDLIPATLNKVRELVLLRDKLGLEYLIQVDGGIDPRTAPLAVAAGADILVAGTAIFGKGALRQNARELRRSMTGIR